MWSAWLNGWGIRPQKVCSKYVSPSRSWSSIPGNIIPLNSQEFYIRVSLPYSFIVHECWVRFWLCSEVSSQLLIKSTGVYTIVKEFLFAIFFMCMCVCGAILVWAGDNQEKGHDMWTFWLNSWYFFIDTITFSTRSFLQIRSSCEMSCDLKHYHMYQMWQK